jgi:hypothetical protein
MVWLSILSALVLLPGAAFCHSITNVVATPPSPAALALDEQLVFTFDYETDAPEGVRIFVRPWVWEGGNPSFATHASPLYPAGAGSGSGFFFVDMGSGTVTSVRIYMMNFDQTELLDELYLDVDYTFGTVADDALTFGRVKALYR